MSLDHKSEQQSLFNVSMLVMLLAFVASCSPVNASQEKPIPQPTKTSHPVTTISPTVTPTPESSKSDLSFVGFSDDDIVLMKATIDMAASEFKEIFGYMPSNRNKLKIIKIDSPNNLSYYKPKRIGLEEDIIEISTLAVKNSKTGKSPLRHEFLHAETRTLFFDPLGNPLPILNGAIEGLAEFDPYNQDIVLDTDVLKKEDIFFRTLDEEKLMQTQFFIKGFESNKAISEQMTARYTLAAKGWQDLVKLDRDNPKRFLEEITQFKEKNKKPPTQKEMQTMLSRATHGSAIRVAPILFAL